MRIRKPGKIRDRLWFLGSEESCIYLLEGENESIFVSGGLSYLVPDILRQLKEFRIDEARIKKILILHSHFDHVGIVPFFKRQIPELEILASARGWEILGLPRAVQTINEFSLGVARFAAGLQVIVPKADFRRQGIFPDPLAQPHGMP